MEKKNITQNTLIQKAKMDEEQTDIKSSQKHMVILNSSMHHTVPNCYSTQKFQPNKKLKI